MTATRYAATRFWCGAPGQASPNDEARRFYTGYVESLVGIVNSRHAIIRRYYDGKLLQLFAGIGVRPEGWEPLIADNLTPGPKRLGVDAAERGVVIHRIVDGISDKRNVGAGVEQHGDLMSHGWVAGRCWQPPVGVVVGTLGRACRPD